MREYLVVYERADDNWSAYVPDLPGCITTGKTRAKTARSMREAIELYVEGLRAEGLPVPEPSAEAGQVLVVE